MCKSAVRYIIWPSKLCGIYFHIAKYSNSTSTHRNQFTSSSQGLKTFVEQLVLLPFSFLPPPFPPPCPTHLLPIPSLKIQLGGLGERCKLPQRGLGRSRNWIWWIFCLKICPLPRVILMTLMLFYEAIVTIFIQITWRIISDMEWPHIH